jgi:hypothetical protein
MISWWFLQLNIKLYDFEVDLNDDTMVGLKAEHKTVRL